MDDIDDKYIIAITLTHYELETIEKYFDRIGIDKNKRNNIVDFMYESILKRVEELRKEQSLNHGKED